MAVNHQLYYPIVRLAGEVDMTGCERVSDVLSEVLGAGSTCPRVDLAGVSFMDTTGLRSLLDWRERFIMRNCSLEVVSINPLVRKVFEVAGQTEIIHKSAEFSPPIVSDAHPITDCAAVTEDRAIASFTVSASLRYGKIVRNRVAEMGGLGLFSDEELADLKLAVGEALTNAVRHGSCLPSATVAVRCITSSDKLTVEISDEGPGFDPDCVLQAHSGGEPLEHGRGITFMKTMVDEVLFDFSRGTTVTLVKYPKTAIKQQVAAHCDTN